MPGAISSPQQAAGPLQIQPGCPRRGARDKEEVPEKEQHVVRLNNTVPACSASKGCRKLPPSP